MARRAVYQIIRDLILNAATELQAQELKPIKRVAIYNKDYEQEREKHPMPPRPTVFIEFGTTDWRYDGGKKRGNMPVILHLVQDCYAEGKSGNQGEQKYLELLEYPEVLAGMLTDLKITDQGFLRHLRSEPDHEHGNYLIDRLHFAIDVKA